MADSLTKAVSALNRLMCVLSHIACEKFKAEFSQLKIAMFRYIYLCSKMIFCYLNFLFWRWCDIFNFVGAIQHVDITFLALQCSIAIFISCYFPRSILVLTLHLLLLHLTFFLPTYNSNL